VRAKQVAPSGEAVLDEVRAQRSAVVDGVFALRLEVANRLEEQRALALPAQVHRGLPDPGVARDHVDAQAGPAVLGEQVEVPMQRRKAAGGQEDGK